MQYDWPLHEGMGKVSRNNYTSKEYCIFQMEKDFLPVAIKDGYLNTLFAHLERHGDILNSNVQPVSLCFR